MKVIFLKCQLLMFFFLFWNVKNVKVDLMVNVKMAILSAKFVRRACYYRHPNVIPDARFCNIIFKGPKHKFPSNVDFPKCRREIYASLNDFSNR